jgi:hypothetical protein
MLLKTNTPEEKSKTTKSADPFPLYPVNRAHLEALRSKYGLYQHTNRAELDLPNGTCTDDVARALLVDLAQRPQVGWAGVSESITHLFGYLAAAYNQETGRFRNFRTTGGTWLDAQGSEDTHARALLALATLATCVPGDEDDLRASSLRAISAQAFKLWRRALPSITSFISPRAVATVILGYDLVLAPAGAGTSSARNRHKLENELDRLGIWLFSHCLVARQDPAWCWPEATLTYESALVVRGLLVAGARLAQPALTSLGLEIFDWLLAQEITDGLFTPIGNQGWWPHGGQRALFDQQPIEACDLTLTAVLAWRLTGLARYRAAAEVAYGWFLGHNVVGVPVAAPAQGTCYDGLGVAGVNLNQGAESTIAWLLTLEAIRLLRRAG